MATGIIQTGQMEVTNAPSSSTHVLRVADLGASVLYPKTVYGAGTAYSLTASPAAVDLGTTDPEVTLDQAGTYLLLARALLKYTGATIPANQVATIKLRRTNNTAADVTNAVTNIALDVVTTRTGLVADVTIPPTLYTTLNDDDVIAMFGGLDGLPSLGSVDVTEACILALRTV